MSRKFVYYKLYRTVEKVIKQHTENASPSIIYVAVKITIGHHALLSFNNQ